MAMLSRIRYDPLLQVGSVMDVVAQVTGCSQGHAKKRYLDLCEHPEIADLPVTYVKLPGQSAKVCCMTRKNLLDLAELLDHHRPPPSRSDTHGYVYIVRSSLLGAMKIGMWRGCVDSLRRRYLTYYGDELTIETFDADDARQLEQAVHMHLGPHRLSGELFALDALDEARQFLTRRTAR